MSAPTTSPSRPAPQVATPSPWHVVEPTEHHGFYVEDEADLTVCDLYSLIGNGKYAHFHDAESRAYLIAAAPAMRNALHAIVREFGDRPWLSFPKTSALLAARSALAIAQGAAPAGGEG